MDRKEQFCNKIRENENAMYALAFSILESPHDAADAVSEAIVKAYAKLDLLRNEDAFKAWILKIVHNESLTILRKSCPAVDISMAYDLEDPSQSQDLTTALTLRTAVESLRQPYRTAIVLFYYEELSAREIGRITGYTETAVKKQLSRAREMLRNILDKESFY